MGIKPKVGVCIDCKGTKKVPLLAGRCNSHYWKYRASLKSEPKKEYKKRTLAPVSDKMKKIILAYSVLRKSFLERKKKCEARVKGCTGESTDIHHKRGRGKYHLDERTFLAVCRSCHRWIEEHPKEAKELNLSENRNGND